jgi:hypothetical protein
MRCRFGFALAALWASGCLAGVYADEPVPTPARPPNVVIIAVDSSAMTTSAARV